MSRSQSARRDRRTFLRCLGLGAATLPFYKMLETSFVHAQTGSAPKRLVTMYAPHGVAKEFYNRRAGEDELHFDFGYENCSLSPFDDATTYGKSFKDKILVLQGIDIAAAIESGNTGHEAGLSLFTGSGAVGNTARNPSIEQYLAVEKGLGAETRVTSTVLGVGEESLEVGWAISFGSSGNPLSKTIDPVATFDQLFADLVLQDDPGARAQYEQDRRMGQSVIDFIRADVQRLQSRLASPEREKLDQHLTGIRDLEKRLEDFTNACSLPGRPEPFDGIHHWDGAHNWDAITDLQIDLLAQALSCDITRFGSLFLNDLSKTGFDPGLPEDVHGVAHAYAGEVLETNYGSAPEPGVPSSWIPLGIQNKYCYSKMARLLMRLDEYGIIDDALVYCSSDMGDPAVHSSRNVPTVLGGGLGGALSMGRYLVVKNDCPPDRRFCQGTDLTLTSNNHLLVAILQAFGIEEDRFGTTSDPAISTSALSELFG